MIYVFFILYLILYLSSTCPLQLFMILITVYKQLCKWLA